MRWPPARQMRTGDRSPTIPVHSAIEQIEIDVFLGICPFRRGDAEQRSGSRRSLLCQDTRAVGRISALEPIRRGHQGQLWASAGTPEVCPTAAAMPSQARPDMCVDLRRRHRRRHQSFGTKFAVTGLGRCPCLSEGVDAAPRPAVLRRHYGSRSDVFRRTYCPQIASRRDRYRRSGPHSAAVYRNKWGVM